MRYAAAEKLEIIRLVEQSSLSVRRTLGQLSIPRSTFYCWYDRYRALSLPKTSSGVTERDSCAIGGGRNVYVSDQASARRTIPIEITGETRS